MPRILISDPLRPEGIELLRDSGAEVVVLEDRDELPKLLGDCDALVVRSMTKVTRELLSHASERLRVIGRAGIGVDNIDIGAATERGILVVNAPTANLISATEHTFALLLALARNVPAADSSLKDGEWDRKRFVGYELQGKTLGVIGFGRIGQQVARRAAAFDMDILAYDPFLDPDVARRLDVEPVELDDLVARADVVTLHTPFTEGTKNILNAERIAAMKEGALLVNCARGGLVDEDALVEALDSGQLAGAAFDVFAQEPPVGSRLAGHPKVVVTPHIGAQTREAQERIALQTARMVLAALDGSMAVTAVNLPFAATGSRGEPYLHLGELLGRLASSLHGATVETVTVDLWGVDEELRRPVSVAVTKGALEPFLGEGVNYVNAERIAEDRGVEVVRSTHSSTGDYPHLVRVSVAGGGQTVELAGTLFGERDPRVVSFAGFPLEFRPSGRLLVLSNRDVPGVVGTIGRILGDAGVNIGDIHLARRRKAEDEQPEALAVLRLDQPLPGGVLDELRALPAVHWARLVETGR